MLVRREKLHQDVAYQPKKMSVKHEVMLKVALGGWREGALVHSLPTSGSLLAGSWGSWRSCNQRGKNGCLPSHSHFFSLLQSGSSRVWGENTKEAVSAHTGMSA